MRYILASLIAALMLLPACDNYVEKKKYEALQTQLKETELKLDQAQKKLTEYESHRYSLFNAGFRTFRMDSITGDTCIKLTNNADWKKKDTQGQSCDCRDYLADQSSPPNEELRKLYCGF